MKCSALYSFPEMFEGCMADIQLNQGSCIKVSRVCLGELALKWTAAIIWSKYFLAKVYLSGWRWCM